MEKKIEAYTKNGETKFVNVNNALVLDALVSDGWALKSPPVEAKKELPDLDAFTPPKPKGNRK